MGTKKPRARKQAIPTVERIREHFRAMDDPMAASASEVAEHFGVHNTQVYHARKQVMSERSGQNGRIQLEPDLSKVARDLRTLRQMGSVEYLKGLLGLLS